MAATLPSSAAASPLLLHCNAAPSVSFRHRRRWQRPTSTRHDGRGAQQLSLPVARWVPAAVPPGANGACGAIAASGAGAAAGKALYRGSEGQGSLWRVFLATAVAVCGSFEFGTCVGYSAPAQAGIVSDIGLPNSEYGVFGSVLTIGAMIGAVTSGRLADILGRKMTMRFAAVVGIFGWLTVYFAKDAMVLYAGRVLLGYCTGVLSYVVPVFISEIAPMGIRGGLATSNQLLKGRRTRVADADNKVYWRGALYLPYQNGFFLRISIPNANYRLIPMPARSGSCYECLTLGRSEKGVYCASGYDWHGLRIFFLNESCGQQVEWELKHSIDFTTFSRKLGALNGHSDQQNGPWILQEIDCYGYPYHYGNDDMHKEVVEDKFE